MLRKLLPLWSSLDVLPLATAEEFTAEVLGDADRLRRYRLSNVVADALSSHPEDWSHLRALVDALNPDALSGDEFDDLPFGDRFDRRRARPRVPSERPPAGSQPASTAEGDLSPPQTISATAASRSHLSRPKLWRPHA